MLKWQGSKNFRNLICSQLCRQLILISYATVAPKYLNSATFSKDLLAISYITTLLCSGYEPESRIYSYIWRSWTTLYYTWLFSSVPPVTTISRNECLSIIVYVIFNRCITCVTTILPPHNCRNILTCTEPKCELETKKIINFKSFTVLDIANEEKYYYQNKRQKSLHWEVKKTSVLNSIQGLGQR
jgi:hypothetical protein